MSFPQRDRSFRLITSPVQPYRTSKPLGFSDTSSVFVAQNTLTHTNHALKKVSKVIPVGNVKNELEIMASLRGHPNVVTLYDAYEDQNHYNIVMELARGQALTSLLMNHHLTERQVSILAKQILLAIKFCHDQGIVHRDLKPDNFVFSNQITLGTPAPSSPSSPEPPSSPSVSRAVSRHASPSPGPSSRHGGVDGSPRSSVLQLPGKPLESSQSLRAFSSAVQSSLKLIDFGVARRVKEEDRKGAKAAGGALGGGVPVAGTTHFMAPEILSRSRMARMLRRSSTRSPESHDPTPDRAEKEEEEERGKRRRKRHVPAAAEVRHVSLDGHVLKAADLWSVGVMLFLMVRGFPPFDAPDEMGLIQAILAARVDFGVFGACSDQFKDLVSRLLVRDPHRRLTAEQALRHPWITMGGSDLVAVGVRSSLQNFFTRSKLKRLVAKCMRNQLAPGDERYLKGIFAHFDSDKDGVLTLPEVSRLMSYLGFGEDARNLAVAALQQSHDDLRPKPEPLLLPAPPSSRAENDRAGYSRGARHVSRSTSSADVKQHASSPSSPEGKVAEQITEKATKETPETGLRFADFEDLYAAGALASDPNVLVHSFALADADGDGFVSSRDVRQMVGTMSEAAAPRPERDRAAPRVLAKKLITAAVGGGDGGAHANARMARKKAKIGLSFVEWMLAMQEVDVPAILDQLWIPKMAIGIIMEYSGLAVVISKVHYLQQAQGEGSDDSEFKTDG